MPVSRLLVTMGHIEQLAFGKIIANQLQADRQAANETGVLTAWKPA